MTSLFKHGKEAVAASSRPKKRETPVARTRDKVQVMRAIVAMQAARHDKLNVPAASQPTLAKSARMGHPISVMGKKNIEILKGWATRLSINLGLRVGTNKTLSAQFEFRWALKGAPGVDPSGPVSGEAPEPSTPNQFGLAIRSKALIWDLTANPLSSGLSLGGESQF